MDKDKIIDIIGHVKDKSNKDLMDARTELMDEFEKTKKLIIDLTRHMEAIEENYNIVNNEIGKRLS